MCIVYQKKITYSRLIGKINILLFGYLYSIINKVLNRRSQKRHMKYQDFIRIWRCYINLPRIKVNLWDWQS